MDTISRWYDKPKNGFTLVELSIVLVVIGLLVSGILVGQDMIRAAELRAVVTEKDKIQTSVMLFKQKYDALPGDMPNATAFWGTMPSGTCSDTLAPGASGGTGTQTCNGNGNQAISSGNWNYGANPESVLFWHHLSNAGMISGKYSGILTNWGNEDEFYHSKSGKGNFWAIGNFNCLVGDSYCFEGDYGNIVALESNPPALTPTEAWGGDKKIDDGLPGLGKIASKKDFSNCHTTQVAATSKYNLTYETKACKLHFKNMW